jgi:hypothetical protein
VLSTVLLQRDSINLSSSVGAELGATSTPRRPGCANAAVPRRHNLWRRAKGPKKQLKFSRVQTCIFFRKMAKIQKIQRELQQ